MKHSCHWAEKIDNYAQLSARGTTTPDLLLMSFSSRTDNRDTTAMGVRVLAFRRLQERNAQKAALCRHVPGLESARCPGRQAHASNA